MTGTSDGASAGDAESAEDAEPDGGEPSDARRSSADERSESAGGDPTRTTTHRPGDDVVHPDAGGRSWSWRGDLLLVVLVCSLLVAPVIVYLRPPAIEWRVRLLILPLLPGFLLAAVAVWATTRP